MEFAKFCVLLRMIDFKQNRTKRGKYFTCQRRLAWGRITVIPRIICHNCSIMKIYWQHKRILHNPFHNCSCFRLPIHSDLKIENSIWKLLRLSWKIFCTLYIITDIGSLDQKYWNNFFATYIFLSTSSNQNESWISQTNFTNISQFCVKNHNKYYVTFCEIWYSYWCAGNGMNYRWLQEIAAKKIANNCKQLITLQNIATFQ